MYIHGQFYNEKNERIEVHILIRGDRTNEVEIGAKDCGINWTDDPVEIESQVSDTFDVLLKIICLFPFYHRRIHFCRRESQHNIKIVFRIPGIRFIDFYFYTNFSFNCLKCLYNIIFFNIILIRCNFSFRSTKSVNCVVNSFHRRSI